jgi:hypothetical protein
LSRKTRVCLCRTNSVCLVCVGVRVLCRPVSALVSGGGQVPHSPSLNAALRPTSAQGRVFQRHVGPWECTAAGNGRGKWRGASLSVRPGGAAGKVRRGVAGAFWARDQSRSGVGLQGIGAGIQRAAAKAGVIRGLNFRCCLRSIPAFSTFRRFARNLVGSRPCAQGGEVGFLRLKVRRRTVAPCIPADRVMPAQSAGCHGPSGHRESVLRVAVKGQRPDKNAREGQSRRDRKTLPLGW